MSDIDTSAEAVERLADVLANSYPYGGPTRTEIEEAAATLRALVAERDAYRSEMLATSEQADMLLAQRDRANDARNDAIKIMSDMARQAGSWQGIAEGKDFVIHQLEVDLVEARRDALEEAANLAGQIAASRFATSKTCQSDRSRKHMHIRADEAGQIAAAIRALKEKGDD